MSEKDVILDQALRELYYNPVSGYQSQAKLYSDARSEGLPVSRAKVKSWFEQQKTYTRLRPSRRSFERRQTYVSSIGKQLQMDLVDMSKFEAQTMDNAGSSHRLMCFHVLLFAHLSGESTKSLWSPPWSVSWKSTKNVLVSFQIWCNLMTEVS